MRVIHIIPSAFNYFDDIRALAFELMEGLNGLGLENEAVAVQYGTTTKKTEAAVGHAAPSRRYIGTENFAETLRDLQNYDIVHLHCPGLGALGKICAWKKNNPGVPLVASYYRGVPLADFFSLFMILYNNFYLPRIFRSAEAITCFSGEIFRASRASGYLKNAGKLTVLGGLDSFALTKKTDEVKLTDKQGVIEKLALLYESLKN